MTEPTAPAPVSPAVIEEAKGESRRAGRARRLIELRAALTHANAGTLARLRRTDPQSPPLDFFRISVGLLDDSLPEKGERRDREESRWALLVSVMAVALGTSPETGGLLGDVPFGMALGQAGVAEMRVLRLLEADTDQLPALVRHVVHQLVSKAQSFNVNDLADLVLDNGTERAERARRNIARNFYRHHDGT